MSYFLVLFFSLSSVLLTAQNILDSNLTVRNFKFEQQVYDATQGTKGFIFSYEYFYKSSSSFLITANNSVQLYKNGEAVYTDSSSFVTLRANAWATAKIFIPYREINLAGGVQENLSFTYKAKKLLAWTTSFSFEQANRCLIELAIEEGSVKQKLKQWDRGANPVEWLPDPYSTLTTGGTKPLYTTKVANNSYTLTPEKLSFYILENEQLYWTFYDEDGVVDQELGQLMLFDAQGDFEKLFNGQMFGQIKGLTFAFSKKLQKRQPISIYATTTNYKDRKGVGLTVEYNLAHAYEGEQAKPILLFKTKTGAVVDIPYIYSRDNSPKTGKQLTLTTKGKLNYFIPFYAWNNNIYSIECVFALDNKANLEAAPRLIYNPIIFDKYISYTVFEIKENKKYMGASGIQIQLGYQVEDIHRYSKLAIQFLGNEDNPTPFHIYQLHANGNADILPNRAMQLATPKAVDTLNFFIPYQTLKTNLVRVEMAMVPDMHIELIAANSPKLIRPESTNDAAIQLSNALPVFKFGDYGQVFSLKTNAPKFFLNYSRLNINVLRNGKDYNQFLINTNNTQSDSLVIVKDTGSIHIILPFRHLRAKDQIQFSCFISDLKGYPMSDTIQQSWTAPSDLHNKKVSIGLEKMVYRKDAIPDHVKGKNTQWKYQVFIGSERKMSKILVKEFRGKTIRDKYRRTFKVHREDLIEIKLVHNKTGREVMLWSGDLGKFEQNKNKSIVLERTPIKKAVVKLKPVD